MVDKSRRSRAQAREHVGRLGDDEMVRLVRAVLVSTDLRLTRHGHNTCPVSGTGAGSGRRLTVHAGTVRNTRRSDESCSSRDDHVAPIAPQPLQHSLGRSTTIPVRRSSTECRVGVQRLRIGQHCRARASDRARRSSPVVLEGGRRCRGRQRPLPCRRRRTVLSHDDPVRSRCSGGVAEAGGDGHRAVGEFGGTESSRKSRGKRPGIGGDASTDRDRRRERTPGTGRSRSRRVNEPRP